MENGVNILSSEMPHNTLHSVRLPPNALRKILEVFMIGLFLGLLSLQTPFEGKPFKMWNEAELGACHLTQPPP